LQNARTETILRITAESYMLQMIFTHTKEHTMRYILIGFLALAVSSLQLTAADWDKTAPACQILDKAPIPAYSLDLTYISEGHFTDYGDSAILELDGYLKLGYFYDVLAGELDINLDFDGMLFSDSADLQLPNQLMSLALDTGLTWRYLNGMAIQLRVAPGVYSDIESISFDNWYMPFSVAGIKTFNPNLSAIAGIQVRVGFDQLIMPIVGAVWSPDSSFRLEATLPEARAIYYWNTTWTSYLGWTWENTTYSVREKGDYDRDKLTLESYRTYAGTSYAVSDQLRFIGEAGFVSGREITFEDTPEDMDDSIDISSEFFVKLGIGGPF